MQMKGSQTSVTRRNIEAFRLCQLKRWKRREDKEKKDEIILLIKKCWPVECTDERERVMMGVSRRLTYKLHPAEFLLCIDFEEGYLHPFGIDLELLQTMMCS